MKMILLSISSHCPAPTRVKREAFGEDVDQKERTYAKFCKYLLKKKSKFGLM